MSRILVTGGAGFIGSHTVDALIAEGHEVRILDNLSPQVHDSGVPTWLNPRAQFVFGDVRDRTTLLKALEDVDAVIHDAAAVGVGQSQYQIDEYISVNVGGTGVLLDVLANETHAVKKLLVASSMSIYGEGAYLCDVHGLVHPGLRSDKAMAAGNWRATCPSCGDSVSPVPTSETKPLNCTSIYAQTKKDQEEYVHIFGKTYGIPTVALRYFNAYGPRQSLNNPYTGVAAIFSSSIKGGRPPMVYEDGHQSRDFIHVSDIVRAKLLVLEDERADYQSFNVGTGRQTSITKLAHTLTRLYGKPSLGVKITGQYRRGDIRDCFADTTKIQALGYRPQMSLEEGLADLVAWGTEEKCVDLVSRAHGELLAHGLVL